MGAERTDSYLCEQLESTEFMSVASLASLGICSSPSTALHEIIARTITVTGSEPLVVPLLRYTVLVAAENQCNGCHVNRSCHRRTFLFGSLLGSALRMRGTANWWDRQMSIICVISR